MRKGNLIIAVVVLALVAAFVFFAFKDKFKANTGGTDTATSAEEGVGLENNGAKAVKTQPKEVVFNGIEFLPSILEAKKGDVVTFKNTGEKNVWPASDLHPTHKDYPGSDIKKCVTNEKTKIFDACGGLKTGESWSFQFDEIGAWTYHDHLSAKLTGTIVVK